MLESSITEESSGALDYTLANLHFQAANTESDYPYNAALGKFPGFARAHKILNSLCSDGGIMMRRFLPC